MGATEHQLSANILHRNVNLTHIRNPKQRNAIAKSQIHKQMLNSDSIVFKCVSFHYSVSETVHTRPSCDESTLFISKGEFDNA